MFGWTDGILKYSLNIWISSLFSHLLMLRYELTVLIIIFKTQYQPESAKLHYERCDKSNWSFQKYFLFLYILIYTYKTIKKIYKKTHNNFFICFIWLFYLIIVDYHISVFISLIFVENCYLFSSPHREHKLNS